MEENELVKYQSNLVKRVGNVINIANKLLELGDQKLIPYRKKDKWGFCTADKKIVIDCIYFEAKRFSEGLAPVRNGDGFFGFIDEKGNVVFPFKFGKAESFSNGIAKFNSAPFGPGRSGFIDKRGDVIFSDCDEIFSFCDGLARFSNEHNVSYQAGSATYSLYGFVNNQGDIIKAAIYSYARDFSEGFAAVELDDNKWGYINSQGDNVIPQIYLSATIFSEGLASVQFNDDPKWRWRWVFIDKTGHIAIPDTDLYHPWHSIFSEGLASVKSSNRYGFIDKQGNLVIPCIYDLAIGFSEGLARVKVKGLWGFIDKLGNVAIPLIYESLCDFSEGLAAVRLHGRWGFINRQGDLKIPCIYVEDSKNEYKFSEGLCKVRVVDRYVGFYINSQGVEYWED
ncbi:MAG TPA: WG repeat-containing protein [Puia sp.]|nr:WG repeat-containing protein [Puia sp.]